MTTTNVPPWAKEPTKEWRATENNRRARYYDLTRVGRRQLEAQMAEWDRSSQAVNRVLRFAFQGG